MSIASELAALAENKANIKAAIGARAATAPTDALSQWPAAIASIPAQTCWAGGPGLPKWKNDGETWVWVDLRRARPGYARKVMFRLGCSAMGGVSVHWGDGTASTNTVVGYNPMQEFAHEYAAGAGDVFAVKVSTDSGYVSLGNSGGTTFNFPPESGSVFAVELGRNTDFSETALGGGAVAYFSVRNRIVVFAGDGLRGHGFREAGGVLWVYKGSGAEIGGASASWANYEGEAIEDGLFAVASDRTSMVNLFSGASKLTSLDVAGWDVSSVTDMGSAFKGCANLRSLDVSSWDVSKTRNFASMFNGCSYLADLDGIEEWDTGSATSMDSMFVSCSQLTALDLSGWDTAKVTTMGYMFSGCTYLASLDVSGWNLGAKLTNMNQMFNNCFRLTSLDLTGWDLAAVTAMTSTFNGCTALATLTGGKAVAADGGIDGDASYFGKGPRVNFSVTNSANLDHDSLMFLLYWVQDRTGLAARTLTLGATNLAKLSTAEKAVATGKNWTLA